ncbi:DUF4097 family beta strand repeat-containing protein [Actinoplanes teichomyceticus]|uniref:DUF4097 family beta strand repeat-containing protein n=1 Tax=Actinoplanes teichomyceticus TaxID=1867 RepID=UPI000F09CAE3|nr:DUF4097 family beta strand repeat-containing protein [Actinoplanes teichomyceticus]
MKQRSGVLLMAAALLLTDNAVATAATPAKITEIVLTGTSADVTIRTAAGDRTRIRQEVSGTAPAPSAGRLSGSTLTLDDKCGSNCDAITYDITAPAGLAVRGRITDADITLTDVGATDLTMTSGDIEVYEATGPVSLHATDGRLFVRGARGAATLRITGGEITAFGVAGPVEASATSGNITVLDVAGPVEASATVGDINVGLAEPASVTVGVNQGDISVTVPSGRYRIEGDDVRVSGIENDPQSPYVISLSANDGDLTVTGTSPEQRPRTAPPGNRH